MPFAKIQHCSHCRPKPFSPILSPVTHDPVPLSDGLHIVPSGADPVPKAVISAVQLLVIAATVTNNFPKQRLPESASGQPIDQVNSQSSPQQLLVLGQEGKPPAALDGHVESQTPVTRSKHVLYRPEEDGFSLGDDIFLPIFPRRRVKPALERDVQTAEVWERLGY